MPISFEKIGQYLHYLSEVHGVQFCIKDFCGFVAINKQLDETLRPFLAHTNPFCMYMKSDQEHYHTCLTMIRRMYHKCERLGRTYFGMCHAGLGEYVVPIFDGDVLLGSINAGFHLPATSNAPANKSGSLSIITMDDMQPIDCPVV